MGGRLAAPVAVKKSRRSADIVINTGFFTTNRTKKSMRVGLVF